MHKIIIELLMQGYDVHFNSLRTESGLHHPEAKDYVEIILSKRLPGMQRKGGAAWAKGKIPWSHLEDPKAMEQILVQDLQKKVDKITITKMKRL
jgi:hypothetical protein